MPYRRQVLAAAALSPLAAAVAPLSVARAEAPVEGALDASGAAIGDVYWGTPAVPGPIADLELSGGFRVARTRALLCGALPFVLEHEGTEFQVDVLRRDPAVPGAHDTEHLSLFVAGGATAVTNPVHVRGARALGAALERRLSSLPTLATLTEREAAHSGSGFAIDSDHPV